MYRVIIFLLIVLSILPTHAQSDLPSYHLDCGVFDMVTDMVGDFALASYESDTGTMLISMSVFLTFLDALTGGNCSDVETEEPSRLILDGAIPEDVAGQKVIRLSYETHGIEGLLDPVVLEPGFYRYISENLHMNWLTTAGKSAQTYDLYERPNDCFDWWGMNEKVGRFVQTKPCRIYMAVKNPHKSKWSLTISLED